MRDSKIQILSGGFYEHELKSVNDPDVYLVKKVLKRTRGRVHVKWLGLDETHNWWIDAKSALYEGIQCFASLSLHFTSKDYTEKDSLLNDNLLNSEHNSWINLAESDAKDSDNEDQTYYDSDYLSVEDSLPISASLLIFQPQEIEIDLSELE